MNDKINMTFKNSNIMKWKRKFKNVIQWNFDFYDFELNVYLYKMHMGVKKKTILCMFWKWLQKNVSDTVYAVLTHEEIVA